MFGAILFAFQIYGDFSGYSDIAIGTSRLFGFSLMQNFAYPYFSRDIAEFWRRWHISLSTWFRDYVYIPLGGSRSGIWKSLRNTIIIFIVSGFWHGANFTFIAWGAINALLFIPLFLQKKNRKHSNLVAENSILPSPKEFIQMIYTFLLVSIAWFFFRAENISQAFEIIQMIFSKTLFSAPKYIDRPNTYILIFFVIAEWIQRKQEHVLKFDTIKLPLIIRWSIYISILLLMVYYGGEQQEFIYFQF